MTIEYYKTYILPARKPGLESDKLDSKVRRRAADAIAARGFQVTVGDVASTSGLTIFEAETALNALAADSLATLAVSNQGEILYSFPSNFQLSIGSRSLKIQLESFSAATSEFAAYLFRAVYSTALVVSIVVICIALIVLAGSSKGGDDNRSRSGSSSSGGGGGGGFGGGEFGFSFRRPFFENYFFFYDPDYHRKRYYGNRRSYFDARPTSTVQIIYSFVFGDGNPNSMYEENRWRAVGEMIALKGGVVTAEHLAPFLDLSSDQIPGSDNNEDEDDGQLDNIVVDESYVLPALARFNGFPEVDAEGNITYIFPSLQTTGNPYEKLGYYMLKREQPTFTDPVPEGLFRWAQELPWKQTKVEGNDLIIPVLLGIANFIGLLVLSSKLTDPENAKVLVEQGFGWIIGTLPYLQIYGISYFAIPAIRWALYKWRNKGIFKRNKIKDTAYQRLVRPSPALMKKLEAAAVLARQNLVTKENAVFRSDKEVDEQPVDVQADVWERKLESRDLDKDIE